MRKIAIPLLLALLVGCGPPEEPRNDKPSDTNVAVANNEPASNNAEHNKEVYGVKNPDRIFQLDKLEKTTIKTPGGDLHLWIMDTEDKLREGMMFLKGDEVKDDEGMIFLFKDKRSKEDAFWMSHTLLPLDIVYIDKDKKVVTVGKGKPLDESQVKSDGDYQYVIEVKQGKGAKFGLEKGKKVDIPGNLKAKA